MTDRTPMQRALDKDVQIEELARRVAVLEEALKPFSAIAAEFSDDEDDDFRVWKDFDVIGEMLPLRIFRRARAALKSSTHTDNPLRVALLAVKQRSRDVHDLYNKNGPQWTSRSTGHEYADMSYVLEVADEYEAIADAALSTPSVGESLVEENERLRERNSWHPMETCPYRTGVDLWCVYGGEEFARYEGGAPIGTLVPRRHRDETYEFFGNKNKNHVPRADSPDLIPVAWRYETPDPAPEMIAKTLGIPLTREDAIAQDAALSGKDRT